MGCPRDTPAAAADTTEATPRRSNSSCGGRSTPDGPVDHLPDQVGVPAVTGVLLCQVLERKSNVGTPRRARGHECRRLGHPGPGAGGSRLARHSTGHAAWTLSHSPGRLRRGCQLGLRFVGTPDAEGDLGLAADAAGTSCTPRGPGAAPGRAASAPTWPPVGACAAPHRGRRTSRGGVTADGRAV